MLIAIHGGSMLIPIHKVKHYAQCYTRGKVHAHCYTWIQA